MRAASLRSATGGTGEGVASAFFLGARLGFTAGSATAGIATALPGCNVANNRSNAASEGVGGGRLRSAPRLRGDGFLRAPGGRFTCSRFVSARREPYRRTARRTPRLRGARR
jgi:hypothetical protein